MAEIEVFQGKEQMAPYDYVVRDAQPPRYWYGAQRDGEGWRFERLEDARLAGMSDLGPAPEGASMTSLLEAFETDGPPETAE